MVENEQKEAPHTDEIIWKGREEGEEDTDTFYGIYNYILMEK